MPKACLFSTLMLGLIACSAEAAGSRSDLASLPSKHADEGFERATAPRQIEFARDHGPHPEFRQEWWYLTGHLQSAAGDRFGFELTFFRYALAPPQRVDVGLGAESRWRARQIYMAHFAVTDVGRKDFHFAERYARSALGLAGAQAVPFRVWLDDWSISETRSRWQLHAADDKYTLNVDLRPLLGPVLNGDQGLSEKSSTLGASYYYSIPRIAVEGELVRDGQAMPVSGLGWFDHEWSSSSLDIGKGGWDWFGLQFDNGSTVMFYSLRNREGKPESRNAGTWVGPDGGVRKLGNDDVKVEVLSYWSSPRGGRYPARWRVRIPLIDLSVEIQPVLADQELNTRPRYWEGAVEVQGIHSGHPVRGKGYVELVGYAEKR